MKKVLVLIATVIILCSCENKEGKISSTNELTGKWRLIEQLADPGDGSGQFIPVESDKTIGFFTDGTYISSGPMCFMNPNSTQESTGTYDTEEKVLLPDDCETGESLFQIKIHYEIEDSYLILNFMCIEPCAQKFEKAD